MRIEAPICCALIVLAGISGCFGRDEAPFVSRDALLSYAFSPVGDSVAYAIIDDGQAFVVLENSSGTRRIPLQIAKDLQVGDLSWDGNQRLVVVALRQVARTSQTGFNEGLAFNSTLFSVNLHGGDLRQEVPWGNLIGSVAGFGGGRFVVARASGPNALFTKGGNVPQQPEVVFLHDGQERKLAGPFFAIEGLGLRGNWVLFTHYDRLGGSSGHTYLNLDTGERRESSWRDFVQDTAFNRSGDRCPVAGTQGNFTVTAGRPSPQAPKVLMEVQAGGSSQVVTEIPDMAYGACYSATLDEVWYFDASQKSVKLMKKRVADNHTQVVLDSSELLSAPAK